MSTCACASVGPQKWASVYVACCFVNRNTSSAADAEGSSANACEKRAGASRIRPAHAAAAAQAAAAAVRRARSLLRAPPIPTGFSLLPHVPFLPQRRSLPSRCHGLTFPWILYVKVQQVPSPQRSAPQRSAPMPPNNYSNYAPAEETVSTYATLVFPRCARTSTWRIVHYLSCGHTFVNLQGNGTQNKAMAPSWSNRYDPDEAEARVRNLIADTERMLAGLSSLSGNKPQKPSEGVSV